MLIVNVVNVVNVLVVLLRLYIWNKTFINNFLNIFSKRWKIQKLFIFFSIKKWLKILVNKTKLIKIALCRNNLFILLKYLCFKKAYE